MFVDEVSVKLIAGKGGDGCTAFRREKYIAMGGPNGGNGGKGADIIFVADESLRTLIDLKMQKIIKGSKGNNGKGSDRNGANAENVYIKVPEGTVVSNKETGEIICDLVKNGQECIVAHGGRGGRGNKSFATHDNPAPKMSELGAPGEEVEIKCELKMLADVGLVGFPSVGKSTILSVISNATPKIAAYHFTTLSPNLGVVRVYDDTFVMADLPGLIGGASEGLGLGFQFLRHTSRCKVIAHVLDMSRESARNPIEDYEIIKNEQFEMDYHVGTMIEIPRAALTADEIAKEADFFSFGTNDLTQMTFGFSRDDAGKFLSAYYDKKIYENDPFAKLDQKGVGKLVKMASTLGRETNPNIHLGICGEHGGDPSSVEFCHNVGLDYVSCSPYRVPIARLAAAQAAIKSHQK